MSDNINFFQNLSPLSLYKAVLERNMPGSMLERSLQVKSNSLHIEDNEIPLEGKINILAFGKASKSMYVAAKKIVGPKYFRSGLLITHEDFEELQIDPDCETIFRSTHPFISELSAKAGGMACEFVINTLESDTLLVLVSGGGSAMVALPIDMISLQEKIEFISKVMHASVPEREVNIIKKALSKIKGGKLAELSKSGTIINCILSDERNHDIAAIASGMTVCNKLINPIEIMDQYSLWSLANRNVKRALLDHGKKRNIGCNKKIINSIIGSREDLIDGMNDLASEYGYRSVSILDTLHSCSPKEAVNILSSQFQKCYNNATTGKHLVISTGEVQVKVENPESSKGGRNQHIIALFMLHFNPSYEFFLAAIATDGVDYLDGVHGAFLNSEMLPKVHLNLDFIFSALNENKSYDVHKKLGSLIEGPKTGTNVSDFFLFSFKKI